MKYFGITLGFVIITTILWNCISKKQYLSAVGFAFATVCGSVFGYYLDVNQHNIIKTFTDTIAFVFSVILPVFLPVLGFALMIFGPKSRGSSSPTLEELEKGLEEFEKKAYKKRHPSKKRRTRKNTKN